MEKIDLPTELTHIEVLDARLYALDTLMLLLFQGMARTPNLGPAVDGLVRQIEETPPPGDTPRHAAYKAAVVDQLRHYQQAIHNAIADASPPH